MSDYKNGNIRKKIAADGCWEDWIDNFIHVTRSFVNWFDLADEK